MTEGGGSGGAAEDVAERPAAAMARPRLSGSKRDPSARLRVNWWPKAAAMVLSRSVPATSSRQALRSLVRSADLRPAEASTPSSAWKTASSIEEGAEVVVHHPPALARSDEGKSLPGRNIFLVVVVVGGVILALRQRAWKEIDGGAGIGIDEETEDEDGFRRLRLLGGALSGDDLRRRSERWDE